MVDETDERSESMNKGAISTAWSDLLAVQNIKLNLKEQDKMMFLRLGFPGDKRGLEFELAANCMRKEVATELYLRLDKVITPIIEQYKRELLEKFKNEASQASLEEPKVTT